MIFIVSNKYSQYVYILVFASLAKFCLLTSLVYADFLAFYILSPPPLLNSCLLPVLLAYLNKMGMIHRFLLLLSLFSSIYAYNEEEEGEYLVVKPSISSFVNGSKFVQTPPSTRRPYNVPRMTDPRRLHGRQPGQRPLLRLHRRLSGLQRHGLRLRPQSCPSCRPLTGIFYW
jgi:hypothetical protein